MCVDAPPKLENQIKIKAVGGSNLDVSKNSGTPKSSILIGFSIINHPFWGTTIFGNTHLLIPLGIQEPFQDLHISYIAPGMYRWRNSHVLLVIMAPYFSPPFGSG